MNDPFGFGKIQQKIEQTQKAVASVSAVSTKLSEEMGNLQHKASAESVTKTLQAASEKLDKVSESVATAQTQVSDAANKIKEQNDSLKNSTSMPQ